MKYSFFGFTIYLILFLSQLVLAQNTNIDTTISINPQATFIRVNNDAALNTVPVALDAIGLQASDWIILQSMGDFDNGPNGDTFTSMMGVFSKDDTLLAGNLMHRVSGAIDAGKDFTSAVTWSGSLPTDVPEDFFIDSTIIQIPDSAQYIFIATHDGLFYDNSDPDGDWAVRITETVAPNQIPVAQNDTVYIARGDTVILDVFSNDYDPDQDSLYLDRITKEPIFGQAMLIEGNVQYFVSSTEALLDSFVYQIKDAEGDSSKGTVVINLSAGLSGDMNTITLFKFEGSDTSRSYDYSMNEKHGQNFGSMRRSGPFGNAMFYDGVDDYTNMDDSRTALQGATEWTIEFLSRAADTASAAPGLINHWCGNGWVLLPNASSIAYGIKTNTAGGICSWNGNAWQSIATPAPIDTVWHYYALTFKISLRLPKIS